VLFEKTKPIFKGKSKKVKVKSESRRVNLWPSQRANSVPLCLPRRGRLGLIMQNKANLKRMSVKSVTTWDYNGLSPLVGRAHPANSRSFVCIRGCFEKTKPICRPLAASTKLETCPEARRTGAERQGGRPRPNHVLLCKTKPISAKTSVSAVARKEYEDFAPLVGQRRTNPRQAGWVRNDNLVYRFAAPAQESAKMAQKLTFKYPASGGLKKANSLYESRLSHLSRHNRLPGTSFAQSTWMR
jgi:hypothetical protein